MGVDPASGLEARKFTLRERQLEGLRRSAALANEPCPEVVQIEDEKNAAEEAERQRIKQEEEERKRLLAGSSSSSSKMSRFTELKSMGEAEEQKEVSDAVYATYIKRFDGLKSNVITSKVNRASERLYGGMEKVFATTSKKKGDPLPFLGSRVNEDGYWEVESESDEEDDDDDGEAVKMMPVKRAKRKMDRAIEAYEKEMRGCVSGWAQECLEMRSWLTKLSNDAIHWKEKEMALQAEEDNRKFLKQKQEWKGERDDAVGLLEEKNALLNRQRHSFYNELLELKGQLMRLSDEKGGGEGGYKPEIKCNFCAEFLTGGTRNDENTTGGCGREDPAESTTASSRAQIELKEEVIALQRRVESLKKERYEAVRDLEATRFESQKKVDAAERNAEEATTELQDRLEAETVRHEGEVLALEGVLGRRVEALEKERQDMHRDIQGQLEAGQKESRDREQEAQLQLSIMKKSLAASEEVNEDLLGELNSIRAELTNSMQDILMTRHIVAAVQVGHHDIAPWRGPPPSTSAGSGGEEEVAWQNVDQESFDDNGSRHGSHRQDKSAPARPQSAAAGRASDSPATDDPSYRTGSSRPASAHAVRDKGRGGRRGSLAFAEEEITGDSSYAMEEEAWGEGLLEEIREDHGVGGWDDTPSHASPLEHSGRRSAVRPTSATFRHGVQTEPRRARPASAVLRHVSRPAERVSLNRGAHDETAVPGRMRPSSAKTVLQRRGSVDSTGSIGSKTSEGVRSEGSEARSQASLADGRSATEEAAYGTDGTVGRESDARSLGSKQSGKPRAMIDSKDLKVMDRLLLRASELNTRVQEKADHFATKRGEEIQRILRSNVWEEEETKKKKKKAGKKKKATASRSCRKSSVNRDSRETLRMSVSISKEGPPSPTSSDRSMGRPTAVINDTGHGDHDDHGHHHHHHAPTKKQLTKIRNTETLDYFSGTTDTIPKPTEQAVAAWALACVIGVVTASVVHVMHLVYNKLTIWRLDTMKTETEKGDLTMAWMYQFLWMFGLVSVSVVTVLLQPIVGGSGLPALISQLNGSSIPKLLDIKTLVLKAVGACGAVASGLAAGPEGPIIHIGGCIGRGAVKFAQRYFGVLLTETDVCDFTSTGAGCGVSAAFKAPLAGILFVVEEASSYFSIPHLHKTFVASVCAYFTAHALSIASEVERYEFGVANGVHCGYDGYQLVQFAILGVIGGLFGSLFNQYIIFINNARDRFVNHSSVLRCLEAFVIIILSTTIIVILPNAFGCREQSVQSIIPLTEGGLIKSHCMVSEIEYQVVASTMYLKDDAADEWKLIYLYRSNSSTIQYQFLQSEATAGTGGEEENAGGRRLLGGSLAKVGVASGESFNSGNGTCDRCTCTEYCRNLQLEVEGLRRYTCPKGQYNEVASLFQNYGAAAVKMLVRRGINSIFTFWPLFWSFWFYMFLAGMVCGMCAPTGLVIPMLFMGAVMGRMYGLLMEAITPDYDPGLYALIGIAAFMGGSGKILMFLAVVLLEITNDLNMLPPICVALITAMWVGVNLNHGLYHELIHIQAWPYLDREFDENNARKQVKDVMIKTLAIFEESQTCEEVWDILSEKLDIDDDGELTAEEMARSSAGRNFAVTDESGIFQGVITISDLRTYLKAVGDDKTKMTKTAGEAMRTSQVIARESWALRYGYCIFQRLGLRNMPVVDDNFRPVGMVTKITLMPWWTQVRDDGELIDNMIDSPTKKNSPVIDSNAVAISMGTVAVNGITAPPKMGHAASKPPPRAVI